MRPEKRILLVVVTADGGLAGGFNANLISWRSASSNEHRGDELSFELIGRKGRDYFRKRGAEHRRRASGSVPQRAIRGRREDRRRDHRALLEGGNRRGLSVRQRVQERDGVELSATRLLPIEVPKSAAPVDYIYEQTPEEILGSLLPRYMKVQIYRALLESVAAEHAARMTAMDAATPNAADMIDKLTLYMNRVRQASITREIIEIVSGAAALD